MKHIFFYCVLLAACSAVWAADWSESFRTDIAARGIDPAVAAALGEGKSPNQIIRAALQDEAIGKPALIKALFCGLAGPGSIYDAAGANGIPDSMVEQGYELALAECRESMEEARASGFLPDQQPGRSGSGSPKASPWNFR